LWDAAHGARRLRSVLLNYGVVVPADWVLRQATRISANGRYVVGKGDHAGHTEAWRVELPDLLSILHAARTFVVKLPAKALSPAGHVWLLLRLDVAILSAKGLQQVPAKWLPWLQAPLVHLLQQIDGKTQSCGTKSSFFASCNSAETLDDYVQDALLWLPEAP
jgi:hypothetical protein